MRQDGACAAAADDLPPPFEILKPARQSAPVVVASPHSGDRYPAAFVAAARLGPEALRASEDTFVDELFAGAVALGVPLLRATLPRAYVDLNREAYELDPEMFEDPLPGYVATHSPRVAAGLGTIPRVIAEGMEIYAGKLRFAEAERRIGAVYRPYHEALRRLIARTRRRFGVCILLDAHSMPSRTAGGAPCGVDAILGDRHGRSCAPIITDTALAALTALGYRVDCNHPYAGGFTTENYGVPARGVHVLQLELNRALYMDEATHAKTDAFATVAAHMRRLLQRLVELQLARLEKN